MGRSHNNADALSRRPCYEKECPYCMRAENNYEFCPDHRDLDACKVHNWIDPKAVSDYENVDMASGE